MRRIPRAVVWLVLLVPGLALAQTLDEVPNLRMDDVETLAWDPVAGAADYVIHEGPVSWLAHGVLLECGGDNTDQTSFQVETVPAPGEGLFYLVTARSGDVEGTAGVDSFGAERYLGGTCRSLVERHVQERIAYGSDEWSRARIAMLGIQGYINEQLDPASIDESDNAELAARRLDLEPPDTVTELQALDLVNAVYARRQLEQQVALFWANHFNTDYRESYRLFNRYRDDLDRRRREAIRLHYDELEQFRHRAFNGNFRQLLEDSALSRAMIVYLDTDNNIAGAPNENYARELLELHTMGVDGGYTHHEIDALARVMTGWDVCKKETANVGDIHSACIANSLLGTPEEPAGAWVVTFRRGQHDCGEKNLFPGSAYETLIPDTCANIRDGAGDLTLALDALAAHPSTARFISTKLLQKFVTDEPTEAMIDNVVTVWEDDGNPHGRGDLRQVLGAALLETEILDPDAIAASGKIKTPFEHVASALRAVRGKTNGAALARTYLLRMQHALHQNPTPTGYPESGGRWIDTNGLLERQNFGADLTGRTGTNFGTDLIGLLQDNGVSTAQGNAEGIVDFYLEILFGGVYRAVDRDEAIRYLETDDTGLPSNYNNARIRATVGHLLGCPEFLEQ